MKIARQKLLSIAVLFSGILIAWISFAPSFTHLFRSDQWYVAYFSFSHPFTPATLGELLRFELFGDARFQPLAYPLLFLVHKTFGTNIPLYHALSLIIHTCNAVMIFLLLSLFIRNGYIAAGAAVAFLTMFLHADTVAWTHFVYVSFQLLCVLIALFSYTAGVQKNKPYLSCLAFPYLIIALFLYESIFFTILFALPFFFFKLKPGAEVKKKCGASPIVIWSIIWLVFLAVSCTYKGSFDSIHRFTISQGFAHEKMVLKVFFMMLQNCVNTLTAIPNSYFIADIPYMNFRKPSPLSYILLSLFIGYFVFSIFRYVKEKKNLFPVILYCSLVSYIFTIAVSRGTLYSATQSRYFYYADAMAVMIAAYAAYDVLRALRDNPNSIRIFTLIAMLWLSFFVANNTSQAHRFCMDIGEALHPQRKAYDDIESARKNNLLASPDKKIFLSSNITPRNSVLSLGSQIFPATMFFGRDIFTHNAPGAAYTYSPEGGLAKNPIFKKIDAESRDFTVEFDLEFLMLQDFNRLPIIALPSLAITILMERSTPHLIIEGKDAATGRTTLGPITVTINPDFVLNHFVIQNERSKLCILQNRRVLLYTDIGAGYLRLGDDELICGVTGRERGDAGFSLENFYMCSGVAKYKIGQCRKDTKLRDTRLGYQVFGLSSVPAYYLESFKYDKDIRNMVRNLRAATASAR